MEIDAEQVRQEEHAEQLFPLPPTASGPGWRARGGRSGSLDGRQVTGRPPLARATESTWSRASSMLSGGLGPLGKCFGILAHMLARVPRDNRSSTSSAAAAAPGAGASPARQIAVRADRAERDGQVVLDGHDISPFMVCRSDVDRRMRIHLSFKVPQPGMRAETSPKWATSGAFRLALAACRPDLIVLGCCWTGLLPKWGADQVTVKGTVPWSRRGALGFRLEHGGISPVR